MKSDLSKVKVGDKIWTIKEVWVTVKSLDGGDYPIWTGEESYTLDGKFYENDSFPSAFTFNPFEQPKPFEGYWAMVSEEPITHENKGDKRFVFMEKNGRYMTWDGAGTDEQVDKATFASSWKHAQRIPDPAPIPEYTVEELTAIVGHEFKIKK